VLDLRPFADRNFLACGVIAYVAFAITYASMILLPGMLQTLFGYPPEKGFKHADEVNNAGQFGTFSGSTLHSGYLLNLSYDGRLKGDYPPQYLPATDGIWAEVGWVTCGSTVPNPFTSGYPNGVPACTPLAGSYPS